MAGKDDAPKANGEKAEDKAKGKAVEGAEDVKDAKDAKDVKDGEQSKDKEGKLLPPEELSEEDQKLKDDLDMLVTRLLESDKSLYKPTLESIKDAIKTSTSSMTAVPKPLKFLRPHYEELEKAYGSWPAGDDQTSFADMLSVLAMTSSNQARRDTLKYRLAAPSKDIGSWGHEYMRHLALEIGQEQGHRLIQAGEEGADESDFDLDEIKDLGRALVPYFLKHQAEADAVDLLSELEAIDEISHYLDEDTYSRVCLYMVSMVPVLAYPDNTEFLKVACDIYRKYKQYTKALVLALQLDDGARIEEIFDETKDKSIRRQMALLLARQRNTSYNLSEEEVEEDPELADCLNNTKLVNYYRYLGKELNIMDPKHYDDIYKTHLENARTAGLTNTDSARHNLSAAFVNGFVNAGFGMDKLMLAEENKSSSWIWKTKDDGMISATATVGMLYLWDIDNGLSKVDGYTYLEEEEPKAGAMLASGILSSGIRNEADPTLALLGDSDNLHGKSIKTRMTSIMGLGLAYAGSNKEDLLDILLPIATDQSLDMQISAMAALSLGLIFVGDGNDDVSGAIVQVLMEAAAVDGGKRLKDKWTRFMSLGLALLHFGWQYNSDVILELLKAVDHPMSRSIHVLTKACAFAGTGSVLILQDFLHLCNEHIEEKAEGDTADHKESELAQGYAVLGLALVASSEEVGQDMILRTFGHLMHYSEPNIRKVVPLAMGLVSPSNPQMKVYDMLSRYSHDNDIDVAINAIFAMGMLGAGTNNARLAQLLRQLASYYHRDPNALFMVRIAQGLVHMGKGTLTLNPFHTDRAVLSKAACAGLLTTALTLIDPKEFILKDSHWMLYFLVTAMYPRFLVTLDEDLQPVSVGVRVGQAVDVVGQAGRPKTITGWQTQKTPVLLSVGERAELEDEQYIALSHTLEGVVILRKNPEWEA